MQVLPSAIAMCFCAIHGAENMKDRRNMDNPSYRSLVAKYYDMFLKDNVEDIEFYKNYI